MSRRPKNEKILEALKAQYVEYKELVDTWTTKRDQAIESLNYYSDLLIQTEDAINALEGKPTLKKMLEAALVQSQAPQFDAGGPPNVHPTPTPNEKNLPPAEPGMKWAVNDIGQDVLVPIDTPEPSVSRTPVGNIVLPAVTEDSGFDDPNGELF